MQVIELLQKVSIVMGIQILLLKHLSRWMTLYEKEQATVCGTMCMKYTCACLGFLEEIILRHAITDTIF